MKRFQAIRAIAITVATTCLPVSIYGNGSFGEIVQITDHDKGTAFFPWMSPGGNKVCYSYVDNSESGLFLRVSDWDGSDAVMLKGVMNGAIYPKWSPDGQFVGYRTFSQGGNHLWRVAVDGSRSIRVSDGRSVESYDWSPDGSQFVWASYFGGALNVHVSDIDGQGVRQITFSKQESRVPKWSPGGDWIAFQSNRDASQSIWIVAPDGKGERRLTSSDLNYDIPLWSPDGSTILSTAQRKRGGPLGLWLVDLDGVERPLMDDGDYHSEPAWSPDGKSVFFQSSRGGSQNLWEILVDSKEARQITNDGRGGSSLRVANSGRALIFQRWTGEGRSVYHDLKTGESREMNLGNNPVVSPDGTKVTSISYDMGNADISVAPVDGDKVSKKRITSYNGRDHDPVWSPDGAMVAYVSDSESFDIWVASVEDSGSEPYAIANADRDETQPRWSPDGEYISFLSKQNLENDNLWICRLSDREMIQVTNGRTCYDHAWSTNGHSIVFSAFDISKGNPELYRYELESGILTRITQGEYDYGVVFAPDGMSFVFRRMEDSVNLYLYSLRDGAIRKLSAIDGHINEVLWTADSKSVFFTRGEKVLRLRIDEGKEEEIANSRLPQRCLWASEDGTQVLLREEKGVGILHMTQIDPTWGRSLNN